MLEFSPLVSHIASSDLERSRDFYEGVLGLPLQRRTGSAATFRAGGTVLQITLVENVDPVPYTVLGWTVPNIEDAVRTLMTHGVVFVRFDDRDQDADGIWWAPDGSRVAWFRDPDGNLLSLTQA